MLHLAAGCGNEKAGLFLVNNGANCSATNDKASTHATLRVITGPLYLSVTPKFYTKPEIQLLNSGVKPRLR